MAFNRVQFNAAQFNSESNANPSVQDSETLTLTVTESETIGPSDSETLRLNVEQDAATFSGTFNSFGFNTNAFNAAPMQVGDDWSIFAQLSDSENITLTVTETEKIVQIIDLDLSSPGASFIRCDGSLSFTWELNRPATCSGNLIYPGDATDYYLPREGHRVRIKDFDGTTILFYGKIHATDSNLIGKPGARKMAIKFTALGWERETFRRYAVETYTDQELDTIVEDLVSTYLADYGITATGLPNGVTVDGEVVFSYQRIDDCFNELSRRTGYWWRIDEDRNIAFYSPATASAAGLTIDDVDSDKIEADPGIVVSKSLDSYRNKQLLTNVRATTASRTESFMGDGAQTAFILSYEVYSVPTITLNGGAQTVGIKDLDSGKDWYWNQYSNEITQDSGGTVLTSSDTLAVTYVGTYTEVRAVTDSAEATSRAAVEGDVSGIWEHVSGDGVALTTATAADNYAQALIDRNSPPPQVVSFSTRTDLVTAIPRPGQYVPITVPELALSGNYFLTRVQANVPDLPSANGFVRYQVECSSNEPQEALDMVFKQASADSRNLVNAPSNGV